MGSRRRSRRLLTADGSKNALCYAVLLQGYTRLLKVLGSNLAEFLQNLNDLHLHLQYCWPDMLAPAFRCEEVSVDRQDKAMASS
jgi:hypothetical protein